jgi:hypothetical protein
MHTSVLFLSFTQPSSHRYELHGVRLTTAHPLLVNDLETNNEKTFAASQQILNKQVYAAVTE